MDGLLLCGVLLLNVIISIWNCYAVGSAWKDTMAFGGAFEKLILWSGVIQSGVGFSMPILIVLSWIATTILTGGTEPTLTPAEAQEFMQAIFSLWYVAVIFPILGSGLAITAHSIRVAYHRRDFGSIAVAGWNSFAQIHNTISAVNNLGGAFGNIGELFGKALSGKGDGKGKLAILALILVVASLASGFLITFALVRHFAKTTVSRIEEYGYAEFGQSGMRRATS